MIESRAGGVLLRINEDELRSLRKSLAIPKPAGLSNPVRSDISFNHQVAYVSRKKSLCALVILQCALCDRWHGQQQNQCSHHEPPTIPYSLRHLILLARIVVVV